MEATRELWTSADALNHDRIDYNQNGSGELNIGTMLIANLIVKKKKIQYTLSEGILILIMIYFLN